MPDALCCMAPTDIASIHMLLGPIGYYLLNLPERMHEHALVGLKDIGFSVNKVDIRVLDGVL